MLFKHGRAQRELLLVGRLLPVCSKALPVTSQLNNSPLHNGEVRVPQDNFSILCPTPQWHTFTRARSIMPQSPLSFSFTFIRSREIVLSSEQFGIVGSGRQAPAVAHHKSRIRLTSPENVSLLLSVAIANHSHSRSATKVNQMQMANNSIK